MTCEINPVVEDLLNKKYPADNVQDPAEAQNLLLAALLQEEIGIPAYGEETDPSTNQEDEKNYVEKEIQINKEGVTSIDIKDYIYTDITAHFRNNNSSDVQVGILADLGNSNSVLDADTISGNDSETLSVSEFIGGGRLLLYSDTTNIDLVLYAEKA